jgi:hypothetical protein
MSDTTFIPLGGSPQRGRRKGRPKIPKYPHLVRFVVWIGHDEAAKVKGCPFSKIVPKPDPLPVPGQSFLIEVPDLGPREMRCFNVVSCEDLKDPVDTYFFETPDPNLFDLFHTDHFEHGDRDNDEAGWINAEERNSYPNGFDLDLLR